MKSGRPDALVDGFADPTPPFVMAGEPWSTRTLAVLAIWWQVSARKWFTGPKTTLDGALADMGEQWRDGH